MNPDDLTPAGQTPGGSGTPPSDYSQMSPEEYRSLMHDQPTPPSPATQAQQRLWAVVRSGFNPLVALGQYLGGKTAEGEPRVKAMARASAHALAQGGHAAIENVAAVADASTAGSANAASAEGGLDAGFQHDKPLQEGTRKERDQQFDNQADGVLGPQSNDKAAKFAGAATRLVYATAPAVIFGGESAIARLALSGPGYAATINPYEAGLAELAAQAPDVAVSHWIRRLGELGTVHEDDSRIEAMFKRTAEGYLTQTAVESLIAIGRMGATLRAAMKGTDADKAAAAEVLSKPPVISEDGPVRVVANPDGTAHVVETAPPTKPWALAAVRKDGKVSTGTWHGEAYDNAGIDLNKLEGDAGFEEGFVMSDTGEFVSRQEAARLAKERKLPKNDIPGIDEQYGLDSSQIPQPHAQPTFNPQQPLEVGGRPSPSQTAFSDAVDVLRQEAEDRGVKITVKHLGTNNSKLDLLVNESGVRGLGRDYLKKITALADEHGVNLALDASPLTGNVSKEKLADIYREVGFEKTSLGKSSMVRRAGAEENAFREATGPKLDMGEAQAQAASINYAAQVMKPASAAVESINAHMVKLDAAIKTGDPAAVASVLEESINYGVHGTPEEARATIDEVARKFTATLTKAAGAGISVEDIMKKAALLRRTRTDDQLLVGLYDAAKSAEENLALREAGQHMLESHGQELERLGDLALHRPNDPAINEATLVAYRNWLRTLEASTAYDTEVGRAVRYTAEHTEESLARLKSGDQAVAEAKDASTVAGMETRTTQISPKRIQTLFRLARGNPKNQFAVLQASQVLVHTGKMANALQLMKSSLIGGIATMKTITMSGQFFNHFYAGTKALGALFEGDVQGAKSGARLMVGLWQESREALRAALLAAEKGRSIINPQPVHIGILPMGEAEKTAVAGRSVVPEGTIKAGPVSNLVRIPGRMNVGLDEFTRVQSYRAYMRMKGMEEADKLGLQGTAYDSHVQSVIDASIDQKTGAALVPEAIAWSERGTFQAPLTEGSYGHALSKMVNEQSPLQLIVPFLRASGNGLDQAWQMAPFLYKYNPEVQRALRAGGSQAQEVRARVGMASAMMGWGLVLAASDKITASGPRDAGAQQVWGQTHKRYSINFGTEQAPDWHSYSKMGPIAHVLGVTAGGYEAYQTTKALGSKAGIDDFFGQMLSSVYNNTVNMAYNQGIQQAMDNLNEGPTAGKAASNVGMMFFPRIVSSFNGDPIKRDPQDFIERVYAGTPVLSDRVPPAYNWLGEYQYNAIGLSNKSDISPSMPLPEDPVSQEILSLNKGFTAPERKVAGGTIDLAGSKYKNQLGQLPWDYMNRVMRDGWDDRPGLRQALTTLIAGEQYQNSSGGTEDFPGGARFVMAQKYVMAYRQKALDETRKHFKALDDDMRAYDVAKNAAMVPAGEQRDAIMQLILDNQ